MKKFISILLVLVTLFSMVSIGAMAASETKYIEISYGSGRYRILTDIYNKKQVYHIELISMNCNDSYTDYVMPSTFSYNGYNGRINSIGYGAFYNQYNIPTITLPKYITTIDCFDPPIDNLDETFGNLKKIIFYDNVNYIESLFFKCYNLEAFEMRSASNERQVYGNNYYEVPDGVLYEKDCKALVKFPPAKQADVYEVPERTEVIKNRALNDVSNVNELVLFSGIKIEEKAICWSNFKKIHFVGTPEEWEATTKNKLCGNSECDLCNGTTEICFGTHYDTEPTCTEKGNTGHYCESLDKWLLPYEEIPPIRHSFTNYVNNNDSTSCYDYGTATATCDNGCGATDTVKGNYENALPHSYGEYVFSEEATCQRPAIYRAKCIYNCGTTVQQYRGEIGDHKITGDGYSKCRYCPYDFSNDCDHICHSDGFKLLIYKFCLVFWKLFKINKECDCGRYHY